MARLQEAAVKKIEEICDRHAAEPTPLIVILSEIQNEYGYVPLEVQEVVSRKTVTVTPAIRANASGAWSFSTPFA